MLSIYRATLRLTPRCDNRCIFCARDGIEGEELARVEDALRALRKDVDEVTFTGGEPATSAALLDAIAHARRLGFARVGMQTNAVGLASADRVEAVAAAGLTDAHVSIHGPTASVHDYHTGREGSFAAVRRTAHRMRERGIEVVATTVLTRSNFRVLAEMPLVLQQLGIAAWAVSLPLTAGRAADDFDRIHPRLGLALPFALHALARARESGLPAFITGAPLCALGPYAGFVLPCPPRAFAEICARCPSRSACPGVDAAYLERFTAEELRVREDPPGACPFPDRLLRMFVGIGELAKRRPPLHPAPAQVRRSLPILGKARPAEQEARTRTAPHSGESLRELFPTLFEDEEA